MLKDGAPARCPPLEPHVVSTRHGIPSLWCRVGTPARRALPGPMPGLRSGLRQLRPLPCECAASVRAAGPPRASTAELEALRGSPDASLAQRSMELPLLLARRGCALLPVAISVRACGPAPCPRAPPVENLKQTAPEGTGSWWGVLSCVRVAPRMPVEYVLRRGPPSPLHTLGRDLLPTGMTDAHTAVDTVSVLARALALAHTDTRAVHRWPAVTATVGRLFASALPGAPPAMVRGALGGLRTRSALLAAVALPRDADMEDVAAVMVLRVALRVLAVTVAMELRAARPRCMRRVRVEAEAVEATEASDAALPMVSRNRVPSVPSVRVWCSSGRSCRGQGGGRGGRGCTAQEMGTHACAAPCCVPYCLRMLDVHGPPRVARQCGAARAASLAGARNHRSRPCITPPRAHAWPMDTGSVLSYHVCTTYGHRSSAWTTCWAFAVRLPSRAAPARWQQPPAQHPAPRTCKLVAAVASAVVIAALPPATSGRFPMAAAAGSIKGASLACASAAPFMIACFGSSSAVAPATQPCRMRATCSQFPVSVTTWRDCQTLSGMGRACWDDVRRPRKIVRLCVSTACWKPAAYWAIAFT